MELDRRGPGGEVCGHVLTLGECIEQAVEGVGRMVLYGTRLIDLGLRALRPAELNAGRARDGNCCLDGRVPGALAAVALRDRHVDHVISAVVVGQQQQSFGVEVQWHSKHSRNGPSFGQYGWALYSTDRHPAHRLPRLYCESTARVTGWFSTTDSIPLGRT